MTLMSSFFAPGSETFWNNCLLPKLFFKMTGKRDVAFVSVVFLYPWLATPPILLGSVWFRPECQSNACATTTQKGHLLAHFVGQSQSDWLKLWFVYSLPLQIWKTPVAYLSSSFRRKKAFKGNGSQQRSLCVAQCFILNQVAVQKHCVTASIHVNRPLSRGFYNC